jgi:hypothetical protein
MLWSFTSEDTSLMLLGPFPFLRKKSSAAAMISRRIGKINNNVGVGSNPNDIMTPGLSHLKTYLFVPVYCSHHLRRTSYLFLFKVDFPRVSLIVLESSFPFFRVSELKSVSCRNGKNSRSVFGEDLKAVLGISSAAWPDEDAS